MLGLDVALRLPISFDPNLLKRDLRTIENREMIPHYGGYHDGKWSALGLVTQEGDPSNLKMGTGKYEKTDLLEACPYFDKVINSFD